MRLKKIEIIGFKSFADKVVLEFHPGITAIVGPNGCGKSNISDAFRWVLGEQSAKSLRGKQMQDVIFAGTTHRKPLNFAEVTITFADINGLLPVDYEELAVTRRLHRSGESDYFINRNPVRLKDVQSLFLDSGVGKDAYSIFEQGKIDQVINYTALERRYIFEEAAGIIRFLQRKREALRKLEQSDQNMMRVKDIHQEVEKQIIVLEEQAEKARIYKENKALLESLEKAVFVAKWDNLLKKNEDIEVKQNKQKGEIELINQSIEALHTTLQEAKASLASQEKGLRAKSEEVFKTRSDKEIKSRERMSAQERLKEILAKEKKWQHELELMVEKRKSRQNESRDTSKQQKEIEKHLAAQEKVLKAQREKTSALESEVGKLRDQQQKSQQELVKLLQSDNQIESELKQNTVRLENNHDRKEQLEERKKKMQDVLKELGETAKEKKKLVDQASKIIDDQKKVFNACEQRLQEASQGIQKAQQEKDALQQEIAESKARQKTLQRLRDEMEGFSAGSKRLLQEASNPKSPLHQKLKGLYELIAPQTGGEAALAAVMRPYSQTLVVETEGHFQEVVAFAQKNKLKDFSLICLESIGHDERLNVKGLVSLLSRVAESTIAQHFLSKAFVAGDVVTALKSLKMDSGIEIWAEDGAFVDRHGVVFYTTQTENNVFLREAEIKTLDKKLKESEAARVTIEEQLKKLQEQRTQLQTERNELDKNIRREEMKLVEVNFALQRINGDLEKTKKEDAQIESDLKALEKGIENLTKILADLNARHTEAKAKVAEVQKNSSSLNNDLEKKATVLKSEQRDLQEKETAYQKISDDNRKLVHALNVIEVKDLESQQQEKRLEEEIKGSREQQAQIQKQSTQFDTMLEEVEKMLSDVIKACSQLELEVGKKRTAIEEIENKIAQERNRTKTHEEALYQLGMQSAQAASSRQSIETELQDRFHLTIDEARALNFNLEKTLEQTERQVRALRTEMEQAGDINMTSIEEYEKNKERYQFLNGQIDDITMSKQELIDIITQLDDESRKIFSETFEKICTNFKKNFKILFNGGEADLQFTETQDVLEAGIEIIARPPGKQMRSINLMSGGEKCLTAMALLFAIFEVRASPYCILDEIDAPLDDSNVERFVNVVKQFVEKCQFIIITHNKRTMAIADRLFGVSMEEKGVSRLLSIEFSNETAPEPVPV